MMSSNVVCRMGLLWSRRLNLEKKTIQSLTLVQQTAMQPRIEPANAIIAAITKKTNIAVMVENKEETWSQFSTPFMLKLPDPLSPIQ